MTDDQNCDSIRFSMIIMFTQPVFPSKVFLQQNSKLEFLVYTWKASTSGKQDRVGATADRHNFVCRTVYTHCETQRLTVRRQC